MGQYYKFMIGNVDDYQIPYGIDAWSYDNGAKLMEHSYVGNGFVDAAVRLLEQWSSIDKPARVVWMGDYGDDDLPEIINQNKKDSNKCLFLYHAYCNAWRYPGEDFMPAMDIDELPLRDYELRHHSRNGVFIDLDRKEYVRIVEKPEEKDENGWPVYQIHPLPLLTSVGCGNGGGDYYGACMDWVGAWAGDHVVWMEDEDFNDLAIRHELKELDIEFKEERR